MWYEAYLIKQAAPWERRVMELLSTKGVSALPKKFRQEVVNAANRTHWENLRAQLGKRRKLGVPMKLSDLRKKYPLKDKQLEEPTLSRQKLRRTYAAALMPRGGPRPTAFERTEDRVYTLADRGKLNPDTALSWLDARMRKQPRVLEQLARERAVGQVPVERRLGQLVDLKKAIPLLKPLMELVKGTVTKTKPYPGYVPSRKIYKGIPAEGPQGFYSQLKTLSKPKPNIFFSPHPVVAGGYAHPGGILLESRKPSKAVYTPHVARVREAARAKELTAMLGGKKRPVGRSELGNLADYETVVRFNPADVRNVYRVGEDRMARQLGLLGRGETRARPVAFEDLTAYARSAADILKKREVRHRRAMEKQIPISGKVPVVANFMRRH